MSIDSRSVRLEYRTALVVASGGARGLRRRVPLAAPSAERVRTRAITCRPATWKDQQHGDDHNDEQE
jgi:hypothetical protein